MADIKTLKVFRTVAACGSFHAAAAELGLSLSAISMQMRDLEDFAGCLLFDRSRKPPPLTAEGRAFLTKADDVLTAWQDLAAATAQSEQTGRFRIGAVHTCLISFLPSALKTLRERYPRLDVTVHLGTSHELEADLLAGRIDFALLTMPEKPAADLSYHHLVTEPLAVIKGVHQVGDTAAECLSANPIVRFNPLARVGRLIDEILEDYTQHDRNGHGAIMEIDSLESVQALVKEGLGVAIVPLLVGVDLPDGIVAMPLGDAYHRKLSMVIPRTGPRVNMADDVLKLMRDAVAEAAKLD